MRSLILATYRFETPTFRVVLVWQPGPPLCPSWKRKDHSRPDMELLTDREAPCPREYYVSNAVHTYARTVWEESVRIEWYWSL